MSSHFQGKNPHEHILQKKQEGALSESHGLEMPGHLAAGADALRETALLLSLVWLLLLLVNITDPQRALALISFSFGILIWKTGRSGWLAWSRLEQLHTLIEQEKFEIEHHKEQEREELLALYRAKDFEGPLLEEVVDFLMSDQKRLLKIMIEEELGLSLEGFEHPLKQCLGAFFGSFIALVLAFFFYSWLPSYGLLISSALSLIGGALLSILYEKNRIIPGVIWNLGLAILCFGCIYFIFKMLN